MQRHEQLSQQNQVTIQIFYRLSGKSGTRYRQHFLDYHHSNPLSDTHISQEILLLLCPVPCRPTLTLQSAKLR